MERREREGKRERERFKPSGRGSWTGWVSLLSILVDVFFYQISIRCRCFVAFGKLTVLS